MNGFIDQIVPPDRRIALETGRNPFPNLDEVVGVGFFIEHRHVPVFIPAARRGVQVDHEPQAVFLISDPKHLFVVIQLGIEPLVVLFKVALGADLSPVAAELGADQVDIPLFEGLPVVLGELPGRRHHSAQRRDTLHPVGVDRLVIAVHRSKQLFDLQAGEIELHLPGTLLQPQFHQSGSGGRIDRRGKNQLLPVETSRHSADIVPMFQPVPIDIIEHEFDAVVDTRRNRNIFRPCPNPEAECTSAERSEVDFRFGAVHRLLRFRGYLHGQEPLAVPFGNPAEPARLPLQFRRCRAEPEGGDRRCNDTDGFQMH